MSRTKLLCTFLLCQALINTSYAVNVFPRGCEVRGYGFNRNYLVLNEHGAQTLYFIQNRSQTTIELEHHEIQAQVFMSPKLETQIAPMQWAAFASDIPSTHFKCYSRVGQNNERFVANCRDVLDVCQYPRVKFALSNMGNYWVSTNKTQQQVIKDATKKGIYLRW